MRQVIGLSLLCSRFLPATPIVLWCTFSNNSTSTAESPSSLFFSTLLTMPLAGLLLYRSLRFCIIKTEGSQTIAKACSQLTTQLLRCFVLLFAIHLFFASFTKPILLFDLLPFGHRFHPFKSRLVSSSSPKNSTFFTFFFQILNIRKTATAYTMFPDDHCCCGPSPFALLFL